MTQPHNVAGYVRLRPAGARNYSTGQLTVPSGFMQFLTVGTLFKPEFTDEGILYRFVGSESEALGAPTWATNGVEPA